MAAGNYITTNMHPGILSFDSILYLPTRLSLYCTLDQELYIRSMALLLRSGNFANEGKLKDYNLDCMY
jgi:hypothetical protein